MSILHKKPLNPEKGTNKLNTHVTQSLGIEARSHLWERSALTTVPALLVCLFVINFVRAG